MVYVMHSRSSNGPERAQVFVQGAPEERVRKVWVCVLYIERPPLIRLAMHDLCVVEDTVGIIDRSARKGMKGDIGESGTLLCAVDSPPVWTLLQRTGHHFKLLRARHGVVVEVDEDVRLRVVQRVVDLVAVWDDGVVSKQVPRSLNDLGLQILGPLVQKLQVDQFLDRLLHRYQIGQPLT